MKTSIIIVGEIEIVTERGIKIRVGIEKLTAIDMTATATAIGTIGTTMTTKRRKTIEGVVAAGKEPPVEGTMKKMTTIETNEARTATENDLARQARAGLRRGTENATGTAIESATGTESATETESESETGLRQRGDRILHLRLLLRWQIPRLL
jgi:hypothetical protein